MPLYDYHCNKCGAYYEVLQESSDHYETICPHCNGHMERLFPRVNFKVKRYEQVKLAGGQTGTFLD
jgi:putative FmdB family regulatory protein